MSFVKNNFKKYFLSEKPIGSTVADINLSFNVKESIEKLKNYEFTKSEILHYGFLSSVFLFAFVIAQVHFLFKLAAAAVFVTILLMPITSQFFLNALPILAWLALFFVTGKIPADVRPPISVQVLPAIETIFYGDNLSDVLATSTASVLDILAWLPYGIIHFALPFILAGLLFLFGPPTCLRAYAFAFGYMNLFGVLTQIMFPAAPPWYKILHGLDPANYSMGGSPGGLGRIDVLFGFDMYTSTFTNAPVPFGAFPSLHSGCATMEAMFLSYLFPKMAPVWWGYTFWLWWCTMYLTHHYFIDLMAGAALTYAVYTYTKYNHLPLIDTAKFCRWSYLEIEKPDIAQLDPLLSSSFAYEYVDDVENNYHTSSVVNTPREYANEEFEMSSLVSRNSVSSSRLSMNLSSPRSNNNARFSMPAPLTTEFETGAAADDAYSSPLSSTSPAVSIFDDDQGSISSSKTSVDMNYDRLHAQNLFNVTGTSGGASSSNSKAGFNKKD